MDLADTRSAGSGSSGRAFAAPNGRGDLSVTRLPIYYGHFAIIAWSAGSVLAELGSPTPAVAMFFTATWADLFRSRLLTHSQTNGLFPQIGTAACLTQTFGLVILGAVEKQVACGG